MFYCKSVTYLNSTSISSLIYNQKYVSLYQGIVYRSFHVLVSMLLKTVDSILAMTKMTYSDRYIICKNVQNQQPDSEADYNDG